MPVNSSVAFTLHCQDANPSAVLSMSYTVSCSLLLLPVSIFVLHVGHRRWRQQRSFAAMSHADVFTYHAVILNFVYILGAILYICGIYVRSETVFLVGAYLAAPYLPGLMLLHVLTCVERYLAVVHPITYMGLRQSGGVRIRNISLVFVWLWNFAWVGIFHLYIPEISQVPYFIAMGVSLFAVTFCSISVLCVLIRPGPGDAGRDRPAVDRSKRRAFNTMAAILAVLWLFFVCIIVSLAVEKSQVLSYVDGCVVMISSLWCSLPVSLVLPLLFIHRSGKLLCYPC